MSIIAANSHVLYGQFKLKDHHQQYQQQQQQQLISSVNSFFSPRTSGFWVDFGVREEFKRSAKRDFKTQAFWPNLSKPETIEMEPINDDDHLDQILSHAKERSQPILIDWMASWCRKCIYLKPKLEKLAAEYDSKVKFYCVDVNKVPQTLVKRGNISKMPTMQIWVDGEMKEEVIGGHKAWIVINEVEEMLKKYV